MLNRLNEILDKCIQSFFDVIKLSADSNRSRHHIDSEIGFPIFIDIDSTYYEQKYFESLIECAIWEKLVNDVLKELFSKDYCVENDLKCTWTNINQQIAWGKKYVNQIEDEDGVLYEFIIEKDGKRFAFRYSNYYRFLKEDIREATIGKIIKK